MSPAYSLHTATRMLPAAGCPTPLPIKQNIKMHILYICDDAQCALGQFSAADCDRQGLGTLIPNTLFLKHNIPFVASVE